MPTFPPATSIRFVLFLQLVIIEIYGPRLAKTCLRPCADSEDQDQPAFAQADQGLHCPLTESLDTTECINGERRSGRFVCACAGWSESARFLQVRRHFFAWSGPCYMYYWLISALRLRRPLINRMTSYHDQSFEYIVVIIVLQEYSSVIPLSSLVPHQMLS